jgi:germination protein YpeB
MVTINYAAVQDNVILYPDLIKVKIALDTGEICSVECTGYIYNHVVRKNVSPSISEQEAKLKVNKAIKIKYSGLAIIPLESKEEILTYEFRGNVNDKEVLVYINANTGREENILLVLETPGGILTM